MNRPYVLLEEDWLTHAEQMREVQRADAEGFGDAFMAAIDQAGSHGLDTVDLSVIPDWAQAKLREWYGKDAAHVA